MYHMYKIIGVSVVSVTTALCFDLHYLVAGLIAFVLSAIVSLFML